MMALRLRHAPAPQNKTLSRHYFLLSRFAASIDPFNYFSRMRNRLSLVDWSDLPNDILVVIFDCLRRSVGDLIRVSAVCKSWRIVVDPIRQLQTGPFLLLNHYNGIYNLFVDFSKNRVERIVLPEIQDQLIINSWNEWIVTCSRCPDDYDNNRFLNISSRAQIWLPPISIDRVIVSSAPTDRNCILMAICNDYKELAFCKQGEKEWKILKSESGCNYCYKDILYFKGKFYVVSKEGNLAVCDIDGPGEPKVSNFAPSVFVVTAVSMYNTLYLVKSSSGNLFQIIRTSLQGHEKMFVVYKLNLSERKWQKVKSLGDNLAVFIGHNHVFIGHNHVSMSISAKDFHVKRDCIYFATYNGDIGMFNLKTKRVEPTFLFLRK